MKRKNKNIFKSFFPLIFLIVLLPFSFSEAAMNDYCIIPPFLGQSIPPNILIVLDNSGSMNCHAYESDYNPMQFSTNQYYGYFDPAKNYKYTTGSSADLPSRWVPTTEAITNGTAANPIASGDFLNWATMSRLDIARKLLIGGKASKGVTYAGAYDIADRSTTDASTKPVKLYSESNPVGNNGSCAVTTGKSYDTSSKKCSSNLSVTCTVDSDCTPYGGGTCGNVYPIYPFVGDYTYKLTNQAVTGPRTPPQGTLNITFNDPARVKLYPNSNFSSANPAYTFPVAWVKTGTGSAYQVVDETTANTTDYIVNKASTAAALFGYNRTDASLLAASGTIGNVTVYAYAKKTGTSTVNLQAVLRLQDSSIELESASGLSALSTTWNTYSFSFPINPQTGADWQWSDLTGTAVGSLLGFGVKASLPAGANPTTSNYPTVSQVYIQINVSSPASGGPYNIIVDQGSTAASGILDAMSSSVRFGMANYNATEGAHIADYVDSGAITNMISSIHGLIFNTTTPLGETLYEMTRYFRQDSTYYSTSDYIKGCSTATDGTSTCTGGKAPTSNDPYYFSDAGQYVPCVKSFILLLTDGISTQDQTLPGTSTSSPYAACSLSNIKACSGYGGNPNPRFGGTTIGQTYTNSGTDYLIDVAYWAHTNDMRYSTDTDVPTTWRQGLPGMQNITLYPVYLFGTGSTLLKDAAIYGGLNDLNGDHEPNCTTTPAECYRDSDGDGVVRSDGTDDPITYYEGSDGYALETNIRNAISAILARASSGTAASVLASGEGSGANIVQAIFYPKRVFSTTEIGWTATLQNLWYYIDPNLGMSTIREDTDSDEELELDNDYIVHFTFDQIEQKTEASRYNSTATGNEGTLVDTVNAEELKYLWEAGSMLHSRSSSSRTIYTTTDGSTLLLGGFSTTNVSALQTLLQASSSAEATDIINYVRGTDGTYRTRNVVNNGTTGIWKLGDIINSTPRVVSWIPLNNYYTAYGDATYDAFLNSTVYQNRGNATGTSGMVFTGANDGMLHAFKLGGFHIVQDGTSKKATLTGSDLGNEEWAFIPKNALPYLKYLMDKDYCHLFYVDAMPVVFDASINIPTGCTESNYWDCTRTVDSWRTILIGGMRLGGACKTTTYSGSQGVKIPATGQGYSSYFALDVTDPSNPTLLWEFSSADLGYSTTGPAIIKINARNEAGTVSLPDSSKNGRWFVVFASGPTGPIDTTVHQFKAYSDQNLKLFVLDLKTGQIATNVSGTPTPIDTGIPYAFGGSLNNASIDYDFDYQDDALYMGYTKSENTTPGTSTRWTQGGVIRLITREDLTGNDINVTSGTTALNPNNWLWSYVAKDIGSVTSAVDHLAHYQTRAIYPDEAYLYFGSGRYFYKTTEVDNANVQRSIFGIKDPCILKMMNITTTSSPVCDDSNTVCNLITAGDLVDSGDHACIHDSTADIDPATDQNGWYIDLDLPSGSSSAERNITDPLATSIGAVFFTTYAPNSDICSYGGSTYLWGLKYDTGGSINGLLQGTGLLQVSTGAIEEINLATAFVDKRAGNRPNEGRRTGGLIGAPPTGQGLSLVIPPNPLGKMQNLQRK